MTFTVKSWNNQNPMDYPTYDAAFVAATARARVEGALVNIRDNSTEEVCSVLADGSLSDWHNDAPYSEKDALNDIEED